MRKARFTEHQIIAVLKSVEAGRTVKDVCREAAISEASYYNWKAKYGGMEAADIKKIKDLEDENRRLKQMFADLSLECRALKDVIEKSFNNGPKNMACSSNLSSRVSLHKMLLSNGSTGHTGHTG